MSFDLSKFYDVEQLKDCMFEVYNCQVKGKIYRLIYNMNKSVKIQIKTSVGMTQSKELHDVVQQGTIESGVISSVNIGKGIDVTFKDSDGEVYYVDLKLNPMSFMDDIGKLSDNVEAAQDGNNRIEELIDSKCLALNLDKCNFLVMGSKKSRKKIMMKIEESPLLLSNQPMKEVSSLRYLGDFLCATLEESVHQTVLHRVGIAKKSIFDRRSIIEDKRAECLEASI